MQKSNKIKDITMGLCGIAGIGFIMWAVGTKNPWPLIPGVTLLALSVALAIQFDKAKDLNDEYRRLNGGNK